jgi:hypothetical protein
MDDDCQLYEQAQLLARRLERISADSIWARRSSGHRGALLHWIERMDAMEGELKLDPEDRKRLNALVDTGFRLLERAAQERLR